MQTNKISDHKVVIAAVPYVNTPRPLAAPGVLKASLNKHGINCVALDLNVDIENKIRNLPTKSLFVDFFDHQVIHEEITQELSLMIHYCADEILNHQPTIIALSLFCYSCQHFTSWLCAAIRQKSPNVRIVIGGPGLQVMSGAMVFDYPAKLKRKGLINDYISGDGENSLIEYINENYDYPGINSPSWTPVENLNTLPIPDYSDYKWYRYDQQSIPIIDSRGCVQNCEFCDVIAYWKKFQYLTAETIFAQMITLMNTYKFNKFDFRSSVSNGNLKEFKKLIELISNFNQEPTRFPTERITWDGSFIIRSSKTHNEEFWELLKSSNPDRLFVGVESVVERVRNALGKNFTNDDLDHFLEMTQKYEIPVNLLCIAAYPGETLEEYEFSKQWFRDRKHYANNSVAGVQLTLPGILPGTQLEKSIDIEEFNKLSDQRTQQHRALSMTVMENGFNLLDYNLLDRPD